MLPRPFYLRTSKHDHLAAIYRNDENQFSPQSENYIIEMTLTTCFKRDHLIWTFLAMYRFREVEEYLRAVVWLPYCFNGEYYSYRDFPCASLRVSSQSKNYRLL